MRFVRPLAWAIICLVVVVLGSEMFARLALDKGPLRYTTPYDPIFVSGEFVAGGRPRREWTGGANGPDSYDYGTSTLGQYRWNSEVAPTSLTALSDFLFDHYLSRYSSHDVDDIICRNPHAIAIYVLGGSVAAGSSASSQQTSWHALLERALRTNLKRNDIFLFNAAMTGFISTQERLAYHLAAFPRGAEFVLILDGANDLIGSASAGVRPGDPGQTGTRFRHFYGNSPMLWLAEHSALANIAIETDIAGWATSYRHRLASDESLFARYASATVNLYIENISAMFRDCDANGTVCLVALQPVRQLSAAQIGANVTDEGILPTARLQQVYQLLFDKLRASPYAKQFIDLTGLIKAESDLKYYTDRVHLDDRGQALIAAALLPSVEDAVKHPTRATARKMEIQCDRVMARPVATIDLGRLVVANGGEIRNADGVVRLIADPRRWAYSAILTIGPGEDVSRPGTSIIVELGHAKGEIGVALAPDANAKDLLVERSAIGGTDDVRFEFPVPRGMRQVALIFRKHAPDGERSDVEIRRISVARR